MTTDPDAELPAVMPMPSSPTIDQLTLALAKAQGAFPAIEKDKTARIQTKSGAAYSYAYADLATILAAVRKPLSENGLAILQPVHVTGRTVTVTTVVAHGSGQWVADALDMPIGDPSDARSLASAVTYARRYGLIAMLGIAPAEEDDDAAAATTRPASHAIPQAEPIVVDTTPAALPPAPAGAVYLAKLEMKRKGDREWADVLDSNGVLYVTFGSQKLVALLEQLIQEKAPVVLTTRTTKKGYTEIVKATRWAPPTPAEPVGMVPIEEIPF